MSLPFETSTPDQRLDPDALLVAIRDAARGQPLTTVVPPGFKEALQDLLTGALGGNTDPRVPTTTSGGLYSDADARRLLNMQLGMVAPRNVAGPNTQLADDEVGADEAPTLMAQQSRSRVQQSEQIAAQSCAAAHRLCIMAGRPGGTCLRALHNCNRGVPTIFGPGIWGTNT
jgi:hypothetical protein